MLMFLTQIYVITIKIFSNLKTFSNCQASYQKELYLLFEKSGNFFERRKRFDHTPPPSIHFYSFFKERNPSPFPLLHLPRPFHNEPFIKKRQRSIKT